MLFSADELDQDPRAQALARYLELTREVMPRVARSGKVAWPVVHDHCFQRIVLDAICGGVWYDHIAKPAVRHMTSAQAQEAVRLCEAILAGHEDLHRLNRQSLAWRGKLR